jgi:hypothetical protein
VVAPADVGTCFEAELGGPNQLPAGTQVRCVADVEGGEPVRAAVGVDRRRGLHAFLHADARLPAEPMPTGCALAQADAERLARVFPWVCPAREEARAEPPPGEPGLPEDLLAMLRDDFDVDVDEMSDEVLDFMRGGRKGPG